MISGITPPDADTPCLAYMTAKDETEAQAIGRHLLCEKLAGCINILGGITSLYHWQGKLEESKEVVLIAKTTFRQSQELVKHVKAMHSYDVPCIMILKVEGGYAPYFSWIAGELRS